MGRTLIGSLGGCTIVFTIVFNACTATHLATGPELTEPSSTPIRGGRIMPDLTRIELAHRAVRLGNPILNTLGQADTVVERIPTPFFSTGSIYRVSTRPPERPRSYILGIWGDDGINVLNNNPDGYFELAANGGLKLSSGADYVGYVSAFLESTRDYLGGPQILSTIEEAWWLTTLTPEETRRRDEIIEKYKKVVEGPKVSRESSNTVVVYLIRDRSLIRMDAKVENDGRIQVTEAVLEKDMPTVMLR